MTEATKLEKWIVLTLSIGFFISLAIHTSGQPQGASIILNQTEAAPTNSPANRSDAGGTINIVNLDTTQQNSAWKAYVGNVSGRLTLDDATGNTIYDWAIAAASISGEVYVSRNSTITWSNVSCAVQTTINSEQSLMGMASADTDSLNSTFNSTLHSAMQVGVNSITADSCRSTATYINDSSQTVNSSATFQEILLQDENLVLVYGTFIDQDEFNYKDNTNETYDFQLLVAENETSPTPTTYYFYLEIGS